MSTIARVLAFGAALAVAFGVAWGVGNAAGPLGREEPEDDHAHQVAEAPDDDADGHDDHAAEDTREDPPMTTVPAGLQSAQDGYTLRLVDDRMSAGTHEVGFVVVGPDDRPVTAYDTQHEKQLHLVAVRRDFTGFQHVHPRLHDDGSWRVELDLTPGQWRLFADFKATDGPALVLGTDLAVAGAYRPEPSRPDTRTDRVDGYTVTLEGDFAAGASTLTPRITRGGRDVIDLEDYLGAKGHLVALRRGDLGYLHVHPEGLDFHAEVPSAGTYELWLDFKHAGTVRTAHFTLSTHEQAPTGTGPDSGPATGESHEDSDDHAH